MTSSAPVAIDTRFKAKYDSLPSQDVLAGVRRFVSWLDRYGETSYDFQTFYASDLCRNIKALYYRKPLLGTIAVAPIIFCEAFLPSARSLFWKRQRFPISDAHFAMGFAFLSKHLNDEGITVARSTFWKYSRRLAAPGRSGIAGVTPSTGERCAGRSGKERRSSLQCLMCTRHSGTFTDR